MATFHPPTHFEEQNKEHLLNLITVLTEGRDTLTSSFREKERAGMDKFYEDSYGKFIEPSVATMRPEFDDSLKEFKSKVKTAKNAAEKIKGLADKRDFTLQQLQTIAGEAIKISESLYYATRPLKDLKDETDLDLLDLEVKQKRDEHIEARRRLEGSKPLQDRSDQLRPFTKVVQDVYKIDQSLANIIQATNTHSEYDIGIGKESVSRSCRSYSHVDGPYGSQGKSNPNK